MESIKLAKKLNTDFIKLHFFTIYSGSEAYEMFKNRIDLNNFSNLHHHYAPIFNLSNIETSKLLQMRRYFYIKFIIRHGFIIEHILRYFAYYFHNFDIFKILFKKTLIALH